jgi:hypothetical protein
MLRITYAPLLGFSQPQGWAQVILNSDGTALFCFSLASSASGVNVAEYGRTLVSRFTHASLHSSLELHQFLGELCEELGAQQLALQLSAVLLTEEKCTLAAVQSTIFLKRGEKVGQILRSTLELQIIEGKIVPDDMYVLCTDGSADFFPEIQKDLYTRADAQRLVTQLMPIVHGRADSSLVAVAAIKFTESSEHTDGDGQVSKEEKTTNTFVAPSALTNLLQSVKALPQKLTFFTQYMGSFFSKDVYVRKRRTKNLIRVVLPVAVVLIVATVFFFVRRSQQNQELKEAQAIITPVETKLADIKTRVADDPITARKDLEDTIIAFQDNVSKFAQKKTAQKALQQELQKLRDYDQNISGQEEVNTLPKFFDLGLVQSDFLASTMDIQNGTLFFLDDAQAKVIALDIEKKQPTTLSLGDVKPAQDFTTTEKDLFLLANGVYHLTIGSTQPATLIGATNDQLADATLIRNFGKNIYTLNPTKRNIFRYAELDNGQLSSASGWLRPDQKPDLTNVQSMTIDGDVWLGDKDGRIHRFTTGREQTFPLNGLKENFSSPVFVFTKDALANLYVLEPKHNRMVVLTKKGDFLKEVKSPTLSSTTAIVADEKTGHAFALSGSLVFEIKL